MGLAKRTEKIPFPDDTRTQVLPGSGGVHWPQRLELARVGGAQVGME